MLKLLVLLALAAVCIALPDDAWGDSALESQVEADQEHEMIEEQNESNDVKSFDHVEGPDETAADVDRTKWRVCKRCKWCIIRTYVCGRRCCRFGWKCRRYRFRCHYTDDPADADQKPETTDDQIESNEVQSLTSDGKVEAMDETAVDVNRRKLRVCMRCRWCWRRKYVCGRRCCRFGWRCRRYIFRCRHSADPANTDQEPETTDNQIESNEVQSLTSEAYVDDTDTGVAKRRRWYICRVCRRCYWGRYYRCRRRCCLLGRWCRWYVCRYRQVERKEQEGMKCKSCQRCFYKRYFSECKSQCCLIGRNCSSEYCSRRDENEAVEPKIEENDAPTAQSQVESSVDRFEFCCRCRNCHHSCRRCRKRCCCRGGGGCSCRSCRYSGPSFFVNSI